jgi:RNA polymerase primary sigma factor
VAKSRRRPKLKRSSTPKTQFAVFARNWSNSAAAGDEEIETSKKIAELLQMERVRERLSEQLERDPHDSEWAEAVELPLPTFRYRLHLGRGRKKNGAI